MMSLICIFRASRFRQATIQFTPKRFVCNAPALGLLFIAVIFVHGCTGNPIGADEIQAGNRTISGQIRLFDNDNPEGVYVWLEGVNLGATANADGGFQLQLPADLNSSSLASTNNFLRLYFYMANYELLEKLVVIRNGTFVYDRADLNKSGQLTPPLSLKRFLRIKTEISPTSVISNYAGILTATVIVDSPNDSATVLLPKAMGGLLGAILLKKVDSHQVFIYESVPGLESVEKMLVGRSPQSRVMTFGIAQRPLPVGQYEVIPYLLIAHEKVPAALLSSLARNVTELTPNYLKIPFRRENAILQIVQ